ncbi:MAG TPA: Cna B-type domain-containing protein, partial [Clostridia bacterium]|nr:Cna B-type domain-containing protein [Clostridia bacterium]
MANKKLITTIAVLLAFTMLSATALAASEGDAASTGGVFSGTKEWVDNNDAADERPDEITIIIKDTDGKELASGNVTPGDDGKWSFVSGLEMYDDEGKAREFTLEETAAGYESVVSGGTPVTETREIFEETEEIVEGKAGSLKQQNPKDVTSFTLDGLGNPDYIVIKANGGNVAEGALGFVIWTIDDLDDATRKLFIGSFNDLAGSDLDIVGKDNEDPVIKWTYGDGVDVTIYNNGKLEKVKGHVKVDTDGVGSVALPPVFVPTS